MLETTPTRCKQKAALSKRFLRFWTSAWQINTSLLWAAGGFRSNEAARAGGFAAGSEAQVKADHARREAVLRLQACVNETGAVSSLESAGKSHSCEVSHANQECLGS